MVVIPDKVLRNRNKILTTPSERNVCDKKYFYNESKSRVRKIRKAIRKKYKNFDHEGYNR